MNLQCAAATDPDVPVAEADPAAVAAPAEDAVAEAASYDSTGRRDPFRPFMLDLRSDPPQLTPLQRYELGQLTVVGTVEGLTLLGGTPNVYTSVEDAEAIAFQGLPLITTVVTLGTPTDLPPDLSVLSSPEVEADTVHAMEDAISSIDNSRALMWVVAAIIVAALMCVSSLERLRDFAVLKSLGVGKGDRV